jgi:recombination DNA repair RAD52 pathway protein
MDMEQSPTTALSTAQLRALHNNLNKDRVARRDGMSYLEAWDVKASLIRVFGYAGFSAECLEAQVIREEQIPQARNPEKMNWSISAQATVRLTIHQTGAVYTESAIANNKQPDWGEAADTALKSAESDALKRAAIYLGTAFGLSLYDDGTIFDVVKTVLAPDQADTVELINTSRVDSPEGVTARERLQAVMKVHPAATLTETPATVVEPTVTTMPVGTVQGPVARALANAEREAAEIAKAERAAQRIETGQRPAAQTKRKGSTRKAAPAETVSADRQAVARQALADAEQHVGLTEPRWGPGHPDYETDDEIDAEIQAMEDSQ